jgi:hypothetical protein
MAWPLRSVSPVSEALGARPVKERNWTPRPVLALTFHARRAPGWAICPIDANGAREMSGRPLLERGVPGAEVAGFALGGVGGELGLGSAQQPDLGGDFGRQASEAGGGVADVKPGGGVRGVHPLAGALGTLVAVGGPCRSAWSAGPGLPGQGAGVCVVLQDDQVGHAQVAGSGSHPATEINLAEHRIRRKQVLGGLIHEYQIAA